MPADGLDETIRTADGVELAATRFRAEEPRGAILVASATAVPRGFYRRFATAAARAGFETLTFDYRGVGDSAPRRLRGYRMDFADWAERDIPAAARALDGLGPVHLVGHSYGGSAFGLVPEPERFASLEFFGAGAGWHGWMDARESRRVRLVWGLVAPVMVAAAGYLPWRRFGGGLDLPRGAYLGWKRWCSFPHFAADDPRIPDARERYARVTTPIVSTAATDDRWAPPRSRDALLENYRRAERTALDVDPREIGLEQLGHMGYFRTGAEPLWEALFARLG